MCEMLNFLVPFIKIRYNLYQILITKLSLFVRMVTLKCFAINAILLKLSCFIELKMKFICLPI